MKGGHEIGVRVIVNGKDMQDCDQFDSWDCHNCGNRNAAKKKRCRKCQSWRGGRRIMKVARKKRGSPSDTALYKTSQQTKSTPKRRMDRANSTKNEDICGMGSRLSKRKRTNLFDSLDPRVMEATTKARAQAWTEPPQLASKAYKERVSYEKRYYGASPKSGLIGHDGNLHYCSICLGVGEVVCCDGCPSVYHPSCLPAGPSRALLSNSNKGDPWYCHECVANGRSDPSILTQRAKNFRRTSSSADRRARGSPKKTSSARPRLFANTSGYQAPYAGPELTIEKPISATPGFFFFLHHHRSAIEKTLRASRGTPKGFGRGLDRNEKVAHEGASIWILLSDEERRSWINVAMKDYEQRLVAWKERHVIESMLEAMDEDDKANLVNSSIDTLSSDFPEDTAIRSDRVEPIEPIEGSVDGDTAGATSPLFRELISDCRFQPLSMVDACRHEDVSTDERMAVSNFAPLTPIQTSLGDDCTGCQRGWAHFCPVLGRHLPSLDYRAKLQPPVSTLMATRIGLNINPILPNAEEAPDEAERGCELAEVCPNFAPNRYHTHDSCIKCDDITLFVDACTRVTSKSDDVASKRSRIVCTVSKTFADDDGCQNGVEDGGTKAMATMMLGRTPHNESSKSGQIKTLDKDLWAVGVSFGRSDWAPSVVLPPHPKLFPSSLRVSGRRIERIQNSDGGSTCSDSLELKSTGPSRNNDRGPREATSSRRKPSEDRDALAKKHKVEVEALARKCVRIAGAGILEGMIRRDPMRLFAEPVPTALTDYYQTIHNPIDMKTMRDKLFSDQYKTLASFIQDARTLCVNACLYNAEETVFARTAKSIYDSLDVMNARAKKWIATIRSAHANTFINEGDPESADEFVHVRALWPEAAELFEDGKWLEDRAKMSITDLRTRENELAWYGALAIKRALAAANESLRSESSPVLRRSHVEDEYLREKIDKKVVEVTFSDTSLSREQQLLKLLKKVQKRRLENQLASESGCTRCDDITSTRNVMTEKTRGRTSIDNTLPRIAPSRSKQATQARSEMSGVVSVRSSEVHGRGLYADCKIDKGQIVAEYIGEYVTQEAADRRDHKGGGEGQDYQFRIAASLVLDATLKGGCARYINHSCDPNCIANIVEGEQHTHLKRVLIISKRDIDANEELTYDYQFALETNLGLRVPCNCGSACCRGFLNWDTGIEGQTLRNL